MTSTCLLVLLLTSIAASTRFDDYRTGGKDGEPKEPASDATEFLQNLPYGRKCRTLASPKWDCDKYNFNVHCSTSDGTAVKDGQEGTCGCVDDNPGDRPSAYFPDLLDFMCPLKPLVDNSKDPDKEFRTKGHGEECGYEKISHNAASPEDFIHACKTGLYCNFARGKICTCPKEKPIRDTVTNVCSEKTPDDGACVLEDKDCVENTECDADAGKCVCQANTGDWRPAPQSRCQKADEVYMRNGEKCEQNKDCDSGTCKDLKCAGSVPDGEPCVADVVCVSDSCKEKVCVAKAPGSVADGEPCDTDAVCVSGKCEENQCVQKMAGTQIAALTALIIAAVLVTLFH